MFEPNNVYVRIGMVPLFEGIVNYDEIIQEVRGTDLLLP